MTIAHDTHDAHAGIDSWSSRLEAVLAGGDGPFDRVVVVRETASTQDAARRLDAQPGTIVVAWRQTAGRGRLGRAWQDTGEQGIAASFVMATPAQPERLVIASAVAAARAAETVLDRPVGIKWPNDIVVDGRKLAGILIEQSGERTVVGIGVNVLQTHWPPRLADRAVSLAQLAKDPQPIQRLSVLESLVRAMNLTLPTAADRLCEEFMRRDVLVGTRIVCRSGQRTITGTVLKVDPIHGLLVVSDRKQVYLPAAVTTILDWRPDRTPRLTDTS